MLDTVLWVEKYRPHTLAAMALSPENRQLIQSYLDQQDFPHLLLTGPPGTGKTTLARMLTELIPSEVLTLNASNERGIDTIRDKVGLFARGMFTKLNVVFLDEADGLTNDAQDVLRNMMETSGARFILTGNKLHKINPALQSRCTPIQLYEMHPGERARVLRDILAAEGIHVDLASVFQYAQHFNDLRKMIMEAQKSIASQGALVFQPPPDAGKVLSMIVAKQWKALVDLAKTTGTDHAEYLRALFWAINPDEPGATPRLITVAKAVHEITWTRDPVILFLGCCAELMESYAGR